MSDAGGGTVQPMARSEEPSVQSGAPPMPSHEREIFEACLAIVSETAREAFLDDACAGDAALADRIRRLLAAHAQARALDPDEAVARPTEDAVPGRIGPYRILEKIGEGGMGIVYLGELTQPVRRRVAIKVLRETTGSSEVLARFEAERQALAMMAHPGIARIVFADVTEAGQPYFVMDYVNGLPITRYCERRRLGLEARLVLFRQVCSAVRHAHQKGVIHRDLKPSNILVTEESGAPTPKIIDFGVAKATNVRLTDRTLHTRIGQAIGTPEYMSPEQADGSVLEVDTRSDVYSLGVVLYELLTGRRPFTFSSQGLPFAAIQRILREVEPRAPSAAVLELGEVPSHPPGMTAAEVSAALRGDLDAVVLKAMAKEPPRRYSSVDRMAEDLQRYLDRRPVTARADTLLYRTSRFVRRHRPTVIASGLVVASLVIGLFAATWQARQARRQADLADFARDEARAALGVSREISDFVVSLLRAGDATEDRVVVREMLRRGVEEAQGYAGRPDVQSLMLSTLSRAHTQVSEYDEAERLAGRALAVATTEGSAGGDAEAHAYLALASALLGRAEHDSVHVVLSHAERIARDHLDPIDPVWSYIHGMAATVDLIAGRFAQAEERQTDAIEVLAASDPDHPRIASHLLGLARIHRLSGAPELAERTHRRAVTHAERAGSGIATARLALAEFLTEEGRDLVEAEGILRAELDRAEQTLGPASIRLARPLNSLGYLRSRQGDFGEAEALVGRTVSIFEAALGPRNLATVRQREILARIYLDGGRAALAYRILDDVLRVKIEVGATVPAVVTLSQFGRTAIQRGDLDQAERFADQLSSLVEGLGEGSRHASAAPALRALLLAERGAFQLAEAELATAIALDERRPDVPGNLRDRLAELAALYDAWGRPDTAASVRRRLAGSATNGPPEGER